MNPEDRAAREAELSRADRANQIMNDALVVNALEDIKSAILDQWRVSPVLDRDLRDYLHTMYNAVFKFEQLLRSHIETGKLAAHQLER